MSPEVKDSIDHLKFMKNYYRHRELKSFDHLLCYLDNCEKIIAASQVYAEYLPLGDTSGAGRFSAQNVAAKALREAISLFYGGGRVGA